MQSRLFHLRIPWFITRPNTLIPRGVVEQFQRRFLNWCWHWVWQWRAWQWDQEALVHTHSDNASIRKSDPWPYLFYDHFSCLAYGLHDLPSCPAHSHLPWGQPPQPCAWSSTRHGPGARQPRQGAGTQRVGSGNGDPVCIWKGKLLVKGAQEKRMHDDEREGKRQHKEDGEVTTRPGFREGGNKEKSRQRTQRRQRERKEKRSLGVRQRKRGQRLKEI